MKKNQIVAAASFIVIAFLSSPSRLTAQEEDLSVLSRWTEWSDAGNMLIHHLNDHAFRYLDSRDRHVESLRTREDWISRQNEVRNKLMEAVGPFPPKTPLNVRITGVLKKDGYRIEKLVYESMPGFYVTGCLFIPDGIRGKRPAILNVIGHTDISFRGAGYQTLILHLVQKGFIVFAIDPIGQGERLQYFDGEKNVPVIGAGTAEHSYFGNQCFIAGASPARYFIWDGIRGIDYLVSRKEVDPGRIGVTGLSGGGTLTAYISAFDDRVKASAPSCYITGFRRLLESIGAQDAEQNFFHGIKSGITHADLIEVRAPKPTLIVSTTRDFFSIQGARESFGEAKKAFMAFGMSENLIMTEDHFGHGFTPRNNEATCAFFQKYLDMPGNPAPGVIRTLNPDELKITATGQVSTSFDAETVFSLNAKEAEMLLANLENSRKDSEKHLAQVEKNAELLSGYNRYTEKPASVFRGTWQRDGYSVEMYAVGGNGKYVIPLLLFIPDGNGKYPALIYLTPKGKAADAGEGGRIEQITRKGIIVAVPDLLGIGEVAPDESFFNASYFISVLTGKTLIGTGAEDIDAIVNFLTERADVDHGRISSVAFDELSPVLMHAAVFNHSIGSIVLAGSQASFRSMVMNRFYDRKLAPYTVPGAIKYYDLPDLIGCIAPRKVVMAGIRNQMREYAGKELIETDLTFPVKVYTLKGKPDNFRILPPDEDILPMIDWCLAK
ncbi:MAG TPA: acetylxylan esterase [Bacteroidales bacterium]|nr:acetylxylan esterase [Bacteroidales bacterium]